MAQEDVFKKIVSHCKEYGFVFPSSEIYDGLGAVYDYELHEREDLKDQQLVTRNLHSYVVGDMSFVKFMNLDVKWLPGNTDRSRCVLLSESTYRFYKELGIIHNGMLKMGTDYPVVGTFSFLPYNSSDNIAVVIDKEAMQGCDYIMVPKKGKYDELKAETNALVNKIYPARDLQKCFRYQLSCMP